MTKLAWAIAFVAIVIWTVLSIGGYTIINMSAQWMTQNADVVSAHPDITSWLVWGLDLVRDVGAIVVIGVWAIVSLTIVLFAWLLQRGRNFLKVK